jgi:hypothetical protein
MYLWTRPPYVSMPRRRVSPFAPLCPGETKTTKV